MLLGLGSASIARKREMTRITLPSADSESDLDKGSTKEEGNEPTIPDTVLNAIDDMAPAV
jgi:hypothetical protein